MASRASRERIDRLHNRASESYHEGHETQSRCATNSERIVVTPGTCGGKPRIAGHRVKVADVAVWHERMGIAPEEIVANWPSLTLDEVNAALEYYRLHRERIDADIREAEEFGEKFFAGKLSLLEKLAQRGADAENDPIPSR